MARLGDILVTTIDELIAKPQLTIIYDGECPFCSSYVTLLRIRQNVGSVALLDARKCPELVTGALHAGDDLRTRRVHQDQERQPKPHPFQTRSVGGR